MQPLPVLHEIGRQLASMGTFGKAKRYDEFRIRYNTVTQFHSFRLENHFIAVWINDVVKMSYLRNKLNYSVIVILPWCIVN